MVSSTPTQFETQILNDWQRDFPLEPRPYARMAEQFDMSENEIISILSDLKNRGALGRIGAVIKPHSVGASTLAAMAVPKDRLEDVASLVSGYPEVNHNYEREHKFNLWFVVTAQDNQTVSDLLDTIRLETGLSVLNLPLEKSFHIDLGFDLT